MTVTFDNQPSNYRFDPMDRIYIEGNEARLEYANEAGYVFTHTDGDTLSFNLSREQVTRLASMGEIRRDAEYYSAAKAVARLKAGVSGFIADLSAKPANRLSKKSAYTEAYKSLFTEKKVKKTDKSINDNMDAIAGRAVKYAKNLNPSGFDELDKAEDFSIRPSPRTLRRWLAADMAFSVLGLIDQMSKRGNRSSLLGPVERMLMWKHVYKYAHADRPSMKTVHEKMSVEFSEKNTERAEVGEVALRIPSYETVRRAIHSLDAYEVYLKRHGVEAARKKFRPTLGGMSIYRPGERIEMDEWTVDSSTICEMPLLMELMTPEERLATGLDGKKARWVITVAIDVATRCILGLILSRNPKGSAAVRCLEMVTQNKGQWSDAAACARNWKQHLTPENVVTDGGPAFISEAFRFACADLGITKEVATAGFPEMRGHIERMFRTIAMSLMPLLSGRTYSNSILKGSANPEKRAALNVEDLTFALTRWIVDIYHNKGHKGLDYEAPADCWDRLTAKYGVNNPPDSRRRRACFGNHLSRSLGKKGVTVFNVNYHSEELALFMNEVGECDVAVRWSPSNIGTVDVRCGKDWLEVSSKNVDLRNTSAQVYLAACRKARADNPKTKALNRVMIEGAIRAISERNAAAIANSGIVLEDWSPERIAYEEDANMSGFQIIEGPKSTASNDGTGFAGVSIADEVEETPSARDDGNQDWEVK